MAENIGLNFDDDEEVLEVEGVISKNQLDMFREQRIRYFDLETQKSFDEVGGKRNPRKKDMRVSIGVIYCEPENEFKVYTEDKVQGLIDELLSADLIVGFNNIGFDNEVLSGYTDVDLLKIPTVDMFIDFVDKTTYWLGLDGLYKNNIGGSGKSADGLQALRWWKEGKVDLIIEYCKQDVAVTRDVYKFGVQNKRMKFERSGTIKEVDMEWKIRGNGGLNK